MTKSFVPTSWLPGGAPSISVDNGRWILLPEVGLLHHCSPSFFYSIYLFIPSAPHWGEQSMLSHTKDHCGMMAFSPLPPPGSYA